MADNASTDQLRKEISDLYNFIFELKLHFKNRQQGKRMTGIEVHDIIHRFEEEFTRSRTKFTAS